MGNTNSEVKLPKRTFTLEFYVGIFAIAGMVCFAYLALNLANMKISNDGYYSVTAEFDNISGLQVGAPVEIAGVPVGEIAGIALADTAALVSMKIRTDVPIRDDDIASVRTKGIIGDKYLKITPGGSDEVIKAGGRIVDVENTVEIEDIIGKILHRME